jgi:hypothetical protein
LREARAFAGSKRLLVEREFIGQHFRRLIATAVFAAWPDMLNWI